MTISMTNLVLVTLYASVLGLFFGASYDAVRILRVVLGVSSYGGKEHFKGIYSRGINNCFKHKRNPVLDSVIVGLGDVLYFLFASVSFSVFLYYFNYGRFRWFILLFCILGFLAYYFSIGRAVIYFSDILSQSVILVVNVLIFIIVYPIKAMLRTGKKYLLPLITKIVKKVDNEKRKRYTIKCIDRLSETVKFKELL